MEARKYNFIVFGSTGFTGKSLIEEIVKTIKFGKSEKFTWAVAGRSEQKLRETLVEVGNILQTDLTSTPTIIADTGDQESLEEMTKQCDLLLNTVGPYAFYGEQVIKACLKTGTHHLDISAESHNLTEMQIKYNKDAYDKGIYIIGSCGFDSIPNECGINYLQKEFNGDLNSVESYLYVGINIFRNKVNYGTWQSILRFYSEFSQLRPLLKKLYPEGLPKPKYKLKSQGFLHRNNEGERGWCIPFPHPDTWAVERSQNHFYFNENRRPVQFLAYLKQPSLLRTLIVGIGSLLLGILLLCKVGVYLMEKFPGVLSAGLISKKGPTRKQMEEFDFSFTLIAKGWDSKCFEPEIGKDHENAPDKSVILKISGNNPAYGATNTCLLQAGLTVLNENASLPQKGGVFTPGVAFERTSIIHRLNKHGLKFEILP